MGLEVNTKSVAPTFPLFFHERLRFERVSYVKQLIFFIREFFFGFHYQRRFSFFIFKVFKSCQDPAYVTVHLKGSF